MTSRQILGAALALSFVASAEAWTPVDCSQRASEVDRLRAERGIAGSLASWSRYREGVRKAKPGEGRYVPHPFPKTTSQVIANFHFAYFQRLFDEPQQVPQDELPIHRALADGTIKLEVVRVENWTTTRCVLERPVPFFHVITIVGEGDRPLARAALHSSGILSSYSQLSSSHPTELLPLDGIARFLGQEYGLEMPIAEAQYVALGGMPNHCGPLSPCIAFKSRGRTYVLGRNGEVLYEIPPDGERRSIEAQHQEFASHGLVLGHKEYRRPWLNVGFEWARAELIAGQEGPRGQR